MVWYVRYTYLGFDRTLDSNDAAYDPGSHGDVVTVTAVAAEPQQNDEDSQEEYTGQSDDRY